MTEIILRDEVEMIDGKKTNIINMREPTRGDMKTAHAMFTNPNNIQIEDAMLSIVTGIAIEALDSMSVADSHKLTEVLQEMGDIDYNSKS